MADCVNLPPFKVRWRWPPPASYSKEGISHHMTIRLENERIIDSCIIIFLYQIIFLLGRWHVNLPAFRIRWRWPPHSFRNKEGIDHHPTV